jgi:hypothetical protein
MPNPIPQALDCEFLGTRDILAGPTLMLGELQAGCPRYDVLDTQRKASIDRV